jgi:hypothetical protein
MKKRKFIGIFLTLLGIVLIINSSANILGASIGIKEISVNLGLLLGFIFLIVGIYLGFAQSREGENNGGRIIREKGFEKSIKRIKGEELKKVEDTIEKIKKGQGKTEKLSHLPGYSIRVTKEARIRFDIDSNGNYHLRKYEPYHDYR